MTSIASHVMMIQAITPVMKQMATESANLVPYNMSRLFVHFDLWSEEHTAHPLYNLQHLLFHEFLYWYQNTKIIIIIKNKIK